MDEQLVEARDCFDAMRAASIHSFREINMKINFNKCAAAIDRRALLMLASTVLATACASNDLFRDKNMVGVPVGGVGHLGSMQGIPEFYINGHPMGNVSGWGGGGAGMCCVLLPRYPKPPFLIHVKWELCDISHIRYVNGRSVDPTARCRKEEHEATVPVNFAVMPGDGGSGLFVHFLPGNRVDAWYASPTPPSSVYPGPAYPRGPAPRYAPLSDEKSQPPIKSN